MPGAEANVPGMITPTGGQTGWFELVGSSARVRADWVCNGVASRRDWITLVPDGSGDLVPQVSAADLVPGAYDRVVRQLPTPIPRIGPADEDDNGYTYVNNRTFLWLDRTAGQWNPVTATASAGGVSVTVQAQPVRLVVDPGNGDEPIHCTTFEPVLRDRRPHQRLPTRREHLQLHLHRLIGDGPQRPDLAAHHLHRLARHLERQHRPDRRPRLHLHDVTRA